MLSKFKAVLLGFSKRFFAIFKSPMYDFVFIHREVAPFGPPIFEWILVKLLKKRIIYDFDDAIWMTDRQQEPAILRMLKWRGKVSSICKWAFKVSCGNQFLCDYASLFNGNVLCVPTTVDTDYLHNSQLHEVTTRSPGKTIIGWTGSHSTLKYLNEIDYVLHKILKDYNDVEVVVIADKHPTLQHTTAVRFVPWNAKSEIDDLLQFDIGIMPLPDDAWSKGKCGFKALQYMALALPAVASPVGVNVRIIDNGVNGFLCTTPEEWDQALRKLINDPDLRKRMGVLGRKKVVENYSVVSNTDKFLSLFK
jgi:glycosyltransferase involved in cell wall biosynthesis